MGDELKNKVKELYLLSVNTDVRNLTLGCFLDNNCDITKCRSKDFQPEDSFIIKKDDAEDIKYSEDYIIKKSTIPKYLNINKKGKGKCCPFYEFKCRFILSAVFREVYLEDNPKIV